MKKYLSAVLAMGLLSALFLQPAFGADKITVAGTGASQSLLRAIGASFGASAGVTVDVPDSVGSGGGVKAAGEGTADLGRVGRGIKEKEAHYGLEYLAFAKLPLVFASNPSVKIDGITSEQTVKVYTGEITNWKDLGGPDGKIRVVTRYEGDSTIKLVKKTVSGWADIAVTEKSKSTDTDQDNVKVIADTENAIGFTLLNMAEANGLSVMALDGVAPAEGSYPMAIELGLVYKPEKMTGKVKDFVDYLFGAEAMEIMKKNGAVPVAR